MPNTIAVHTVGLIDRTRTQLTAGLADHPQVETRHSTGWSFSLLQADVIVLGTDTSVGQEVLDMLKYYAGVKQPRLVTLSESDERMYALGGHGAHPSFAVRLEHALRRAGCRNAGLVTARLEPAALEQESPGSPVPTPRHAVQWRD